MQFAVDFMKKFLIIGLVVTFCFVIFAEMAFYLTAKLEFDTEISLAHSAAFTYATTDTNISGVLGTIGKHDTIPRSLYWDEFTRQVDERLLATGTNKSNWFTRPKMKMENYTSYGQAKNIVTVTTDYVYQGNYMKKLHNSGIIPTIDLTRRLEVDLDYRN